MPLNVQNFSMLEEMERRENEEKKLKRQMVKQRLKIEKERLRRMKSINDAKMLVREKNRQLITSPSQSADSVQTELEGDDLSQSQPKENSEQQVREWVALERKF
jgi:hypothetical protein